MADKIYRMQTGGRGPQKKSSMLTEEVFHAHRYMLNQLNVISNDESQ